MCPSAHKRPYSIWIWIDSCRIWPAPTVTFWVPSGGVFPTDAASSYSPGTTWIVWPSASMPGPKTLSCPDVVR